MRAMDSKSAIIFTTLGTIDELALTTLGINAKETDEGSESPIGFFGTGLKYAIAVLLRNDCTIEIHSNNWIYTFSTEPHSVRGKSFDVVVMHKSANGASEIRTLGFTTELGKNWLPWMAYRELWSNTLDERGTCACGAPDDTLHNATQIIVRGEVIFEVWRNRSLYFLDTNAMGAPAANNFDLQVWLHPSPGIFYRGIRVTDEPTLLTYNFTSSIDLTEDRTARSMYQIETRIESLLGSTDSEEMIRTIATAPPNSWENNRITSAGYGTPGFTFMRVVGELFDRRDSSLRQLIAHEYLKHRPPAEILATNLSKLESAMLQRALRALADIGVKPTAEIVVTETLGSDVLGQASQGKIFLSRRAFHSGTKMLAGTIFEEHIHLVYHHMDRSRSMQNYLIDFCMTLAEQIRSEPI